MNENPCLSQTAAGVVGGALTISLCFLAAASSPAEIWQIDETPLFSRGHGGTWDSLSVSDPVVIHPTEGWTLFYTGSGVDEEGRRTAFGRAQSKDGVHWQKSGAGPAFEPDVGPYQSVANPSVIPWGDSYLMAYLVRTDLIRPDTTFDSEDRVAPVEMRIARSADGIHWRDDLNAKTPVNSQHPFDFEPCLYADGEVLHLWWRAPAGNHEVLCHSVSRDALKWSKPSTQPTQDIDPLPISGVRVYPSGDYYIITYVAYDADKKTFQLITKLSRDARTWMRKGPPPFSIQSRCIPFMTFTTQGARVCFESHERLPSGMVASASGLRTAFCPKSAYEGN